jgi:hypothetical protein
MSARNLRAALRHRLGRDRAIERLLREHSAGGLLRVFHAQELADAGDGPGRAAASPRASPRRKRA